MPHSQKIIKTCPLGGDILATVSDQTSHYFGGYFHVRIQISAVVPLFADAFASEAEFQDALKRLGDSVNFSRTLEKMAVPDGEIDAVRQHLLASFDRHMLPYLTRADFAGSFVQSEYRKVLKPRSGFQR